MYGVVARSCVTGTENKNCPILLPSLSEAYTFQCVQRASHITARPPEIVAEALVVSVRTLAGEVMVAACTSATELEFTNVTVFAVEATATAFEMLLLELLKPVTVQTVPTRPLLIPGGPNFTFCAGA